MPEEINKSVDTRSSAASGPALVHDDTTAKWFLISSIAYFFIVGIIAVTIAAKFVWPSLLGTVQYLTYGRLRPLHVNGMLFGWLLAADMGLSFFMVPRLCAVKLWSEKLGVATAILWNAIILGAVVSLLMGWNQGLEYAELPMPLDIAVVVAWIMFGVNIFMTIASRKYDQMYVSIWYIMGTILWTAFVYLTGNFAVLFATGTNQANLNWMYVHNAVGLIFTPVGLAIAYYFIPKASNTPLYSHKLSMIGFWSLAFVYVWTGAHHMLHGPISQWLQTISIAFSVMLLIPVWAVVYNFFATMKGQWHQLKDNVPLKFLMSGVVFYLLTCFQGPMHSLRTVNAIVSKTDWIPGHAHMAVLGAFSFFAIAGCYHMIPRAFKTTIFSEALANWSFWFLMFGGLGFFVTLWLGGFWQGWQWNNPSIPFIDTVIALKPVWIVRFFSGILMFLGIVSFGYNIMATILGAKDRPAAA
ncbi:cbb3-type cytochrome c oxidase subunit I [Paludibaculum fermentans]|uniref:Cbb3-type cytochrome c oxidase subunit I n=1 Tax=Paludibaculum fermentans TaxID=1473598 RepID=A0A7S7NWX5_PALFE|nr:cbb3-type cytochrome c oxidase subunit I [Paludibaculum fermentans]QOY91310.1 cbb3-type cytochrome c oxidase subunit I [Paludibaculum fermentans]